jgi:hypothetical protein
MPLDVFCPDLRSSAFICVYLRSSAFICGKKFSMHSVESTAESGLRFVIGHRLSFLKPEH